MRNETGDAAPATNRGGRPRVFKEKMTRRERVARHRAKKKANPKPPSVPRKTSKPGKVLAQWSKENLIVPAPHRNEGKPFVLPKFLIEFLDDAATHPESLLCIARKNAKSAAVAVYALARLCGPLAIPNWRGGCLSITKEKARELYRQMESIVEASNLAGVKFWKSGRVTGHLGGEFEIMVNAHASGLDDAIVDELGLLQEKDREDVNSMRTSVSARGGRFIALTIHGSGPFVPEILARKGHAGLAVHHYFAPEDCELDDREAWKSANPGLGKVKELSYMKTESARVAATPADESSFRALDLNAPLEPSDEIILTASDLKHHLFTNELPDRVGPVVLTFDFGESKSATAAFAIWPMCGRCEVWMGLPSIPSLRTRSKADDSKYLEMEARGELKVYPGRVTPVKDFLRDVISDLEGSPVLHCMSDQYKRKEAQDFLDVSSGWQLELSAGVQGHAADVRSLTRLVHSGRLKMKPSLAFTTAIAKHKAVRDQSGNPKINKKKQKGRIDVLSAALIGAGIAEQYFDAPWLLQPQMEVHYV